MKAPSTLKKFKRVKTLEETTVEESLLFGALFALIPLTILILLTPLAIFLNSLGAAGAISGYTITFMSLSAICSLFWGIRFDFSHRQFHLLAKFIFAINGGVSMLFIIYSYLVFTVLVGSVSYPDAPVIWIGGTINLLLIALLILLKKVFGKQISRWFRIKYIPTNMSSELATKTIEKAERDLDHKKYKTASDRFHSAAIVYINLEKWKEAGKNYLRAAEIYSIKKDNAFEVSFMYCLSAASFILNKNIENALKALENAEEVIKTAQIPDRAKKNISYLLTLLTIICNGKIDKAEESWKTLQRKVMRWDYPIVEETVLLMERILKQ